ncbi:MAG: ATP-binding protein [Saprospiraceae bacterium]|nr:ATP-binding protein [Saprospiraceae bacterium]
MNQNTLDLMRQMKFNGMYNAFKLSLDSGKSEQLTPDEMVAQLIQSEWDERHNRSILKKVQNARFRYKAAVEDVYYGKDRNLDKNQIHRLVQCTFIDNFENILITGSTGIGKSYLASALGYHACSMGYKVAYFNATKLFARLKMAKADGSYIRDVSKIERVDLLILDDFGLQPLDNLNRAAMMEIIEDRHGKGSLIITSQIPVNKWHDIIGEQTVADAIMDRIIHEAHRLELKGESLRKKEKRMEELMTDFN